MLPARALLQLFEKITIRVVRARQNQENFQKLTFEKKKLFCVLKKNNSEQAVFSLLLMSFDDFRCKKQPMG